MTPGQYHTLTIDRFTTVGAFLVQGEAEVLLPRKYLTPDLQVGQTLSVFVYQDQQGRPVATTQTPLAIAGQFAVLKVAYTNHFGAFLDWGLEKDLLVPFAEQPVRMEQGKRYLVYIFVDEVSNRLVASAKVNKFLDQAPFPYAAGDPVNIMIGPKTPLGITAIIDQKYKGVLYHNEVFERFHLGDYTTAFVHQVRPDGKVDLRLKPSGVAALDRDAEALKMLLRQHKGFLALTDQSSPELIASVAHMSKKAFKKAAGQLYKARLIDITPEGIQWLNP